MPKKNEINNFWAQIQLLSNNAGEKYKYARNYILTNLKNMKSLLITICGDGGLTGPNGCFKDLQEAFDSLEMDVKVGTNGSQQHW